MSHQHVRDRERLLSAFGACHVGCGQKIDVPNYIWLKLILSICLIPRTYNAGGWWGRCQEACWLAEANNLGFEISVRDKSERVTAMGEGRLVYLSCPSVYRRKGWRGPGKVWRFSLRVLKADLTQDNPDRVCDPLLM